VAVVITLTPGYVVKPLRGKYGTAEPDEFSPAKLVVYRRTIKEQLITKECLKNKFGISSRTWGGNGDSNLLQ